MNIPKYFLCIYCFFCLRNKDTNGCVGYKVNISLFNNSKDLYTDIRYSRSPYPRKDINMCFDDWNRIIIKLR